MKKPNILLFRNKQIAISYLAILFSSIGLGIGQFLYPLRFLELGGNEALVSLATAAFSIGQLLGIFVLSKLLNKTGFEFLIGVSSWVFAIALPVIPWYPIMFFSKFFEGLGYGIITIAVLTLCSTEAKECISEGIGTLLGAIFLGTALGQGIGGLMKTYLFEVWNFSGKFTALQMSFLFAIIVSFIPILISLYQSIKTRRILEQKDKMSLSHFHFKDLKKLFLIPSFVFLLILYSLYDLSHGLYTPNLIVMFTNHGFTEAATGVIFFLGDAIWGISQIFTGKLADKLGNWIPIILSIIIKGVGVILYPLAPGIYVLGGAFIIVGVAEALMEPARNCEVLTIESRLKIDEKITIIEHNHKHINFNYIRGRGMEIGIHTHNHNHELNKETILGIFQIAGIISFGIGGSLGSLLISQAVSLEIITYIGAGIILFNIIFGTIGLSLARKRKKIPEGSKNNLNGEEK
ncbi:MAG TPA: MFS transporter [Candidatus Bathyarchaeia archaeon]|nr:MFS transporter [Candidatus Bathyarchaeia archaeon]